jgi:hypothetical protein
MAARRSPSRGSTPNIESNLKVVLSRCKGLNRILATSVFAAFPLDKSPSQKYYPDLNLVMSSELAGGYQRRLDPKWERFLLRLLGSGQ